MSTGSLPPDFTPLGSRLEALTNVRRAHAAVAHKIGDARSPRDYGCRRLWNSNPTARRRRQAVLDAAVKIGVHSGARSYAMGKCEGGAP
jgi:hypothetical protein